MWTIDVLRSRAFRLALAFALAIAAAATVVFTLIYLQFSAAAVRTVGARLIFEANRALEESDDELRARITQRLRVRSAASRLRRAVQREGRPAAWRPAQPAAVRADGRPNYRQSAGARIGASPIKRSSSPSGAPTAPSWRLDAASPRSTRCAKRWRARWPSP